MKNTSVAKSRVFLLEDDQSLGVTLTERLCKEGFEVQWAKSVADVNKTELANRFDLLILDVGLPDGSGFDVAKEVREVADVPLIFLTAQSSAESRLRGYEIGAEEYIPKPFHLRELFLRIQHVLANHARSQKISIGDVTIDFASLWIEAKGAAGDLVKEKLNPKEARVLRLLIEHSPKVVSRDELLDRVWGEAEFPSNRTVDNVIVRLRQLLGPTVGQNIVSVRGIGYQWVQR